MNSSTPVASNGRSSIVCASGTSPPSAVSASGRVIRYEHDGPFGAEPAELADQPERGRVGPVHVLDREQHRLRVGEAAERRRDRRVQAAAEGLGLELLDTRRRLAQDSRDERATVLACRLDELGVSRAAASVKGQ